MKHGFHIYLDAILDTRIGLLHTLNPEAAIEVVKQAEKYRTRPSDELGFLSPLVDEAVFKEAWKNRTADILPHSVPTHVMSAIAPIIQKLEKQKHLYPEMMESIFVEVNVYPYILDPLVMNDIAVAVTAHLGTMAPVKCVYEPPVKIAPKNLRNGNISMVVIYDLQEWINGALAEQHGVNETAADVTVVAPALMQTIKGIPSPEQFVDNHGKQVDPHDLMQQLLSPIIGFDFWPIGIFSLMDITSLFKENPPT